MRPTLRDSEKPDATAPHPAHAAIEALAKRMAAQSGQDAHLTVEAKVRNRLNGGYSYRDDRLAVSLPSDYDAGNPNVEAVIAHELGHRGEPDLLMCNHALSCAFEIGRVVVCLELIAVGIAAELRGWGPQLTFVGCLVAAFLSLYLLGTVKWPREFAADAHAARLIGKEATIANLTTLPSGWLDLDHPPRKLRIAAVRKLTTP